MQGVCLVSLVLIGRSGVRCCFVWLRSDCLKKLVGAVRWGAGAQNIKSVWSWFLP